MSTLAKAIRNLAFPDGIRATNVTLAEYKGIKLLIHFKNGDDGRLRMVSEETTGRFIKGTWGISDQEVLNYAKFIIDKTGIEKVKAALAGLPVINQPIPAPSPTIQTGTCPE